MYPLPHLFVSMSFMEQISGNSCLSFSPCCRWKVHDDWVSQLKYYDSLRAVISCSNHPETALVIGKFNRLSGLFYGLPSLAIASSPFALVYSPDFSASPSSTNFKFHLLL